MFAIQDNSMANKSKKNRPIVEKALELDATGMSNAEISRQLGVHCNTVRGWFKALGMPPKKMGSNYLHVARSAAKTEERADKLEELAEGLEDNLEKLASGISTEIRLAASEEEDYAIADLAECQSSPADKYQSYVAAAAIKIMRDSIKSLRGPKSIRELSELDQLIRRNLGLNSKTSGGSGKMQIDISILNNTLADRGKGTVKEMRKTIDAEILPAKPND